MRATWYASTFGLEPESRRNQWDST
jgi:hypothetical protein